MRRAGGAAFAHVERTDDGEGVCRDGDPLHLPVGRGPARDPPDISRQHDGVAAAEGQNDGLHGEGDGEEVLGPGVCLLEVDDFGSAAIGEIAGQFEIGPEAGKGHDGADGPVYQGQADGASGLEDISRCGVLVGFWGKGMAG